MKQNLLNLIIIAVLSIVVINQGFSQNNSKAESIEDWETGDFSQYEWQFEGDAEWFITDQDQYEGVYSAQSGDINDSQSNGISIEYNVYAEDTLSFWYKVSSEGGWDYLRFYIDGSEVDEWAGEIPWAQATYVIPVGTHTFKWAYEKDGSVSNGLDACWVDYIVLPPMEISAGFYADTTVICKNDVVYFFDQSVGPVTEWNWIFEGATPSSSTNQNPVVAYPTVGEWDVFLEVSDGIESGQLYMGSYIAVANTPAPAPTPSGISFLCASWGNTSYNTTGMSGITEYDWMIDPPEAGTISGGGTNITVVWEPDFLGEADLMVAGINYCGIGNYSVPLTITRYLPDVTVVLPAFVALSTPAFQLTGGNPVGGEYTGTGVANGMFDPSVAGLGTHTITYTYTDVNLCSNFATDDITVTEFTGIINQSDQSAINIYPNPNNGNFKVKFNIEQNDLVNLRIYNTMNSIVYEENNISISQSFAKDLNLTNLTKGVYYLHIDGKSTNLIKKLVIQ